MIHPSMVSGSHEAVPRHCYSACNRIGKQLSRCHLMPCPKQDGRTQHMIRMTLDLTLTRLVCWAPQGGCGGVRMGMAGPCECREPHPCHATQAVFVDDAADLRVSSDTVLLKLGRFG
jgi:hypothetical protein